MATRRVNPKLMAAFEAAQLAPVEEPEQVPQPAAPKSRLDVVREYLDATRESAAPPAYVEPNMAAARDADARAGLMDSFRRSGLAFLGRADRSARGPFNANEAAALAQQKARRDELAKWAESQAKTRMNEADVLSRAAAQPVVRDPELEERKLDIEQQKVDIQRDKANRPKAPSSRSGAPKADEGKTLPSSTVEGLADLPVAEAAVDEMVTEFNRLNMGGVAGRVGSFVNRMGGSELAPDSAQYEAVAKIGMQSIGKILEGGKLAVGDEVKYQAMLPRGGDSPQVVEAKRSHLKAFMRSLVEMRAKGLKESGYKVPAEFLGGGAPRTVVRTGTNKKTGKRVVEYSDGTREEQ